LLLLCFISNDFLNKGHLLQTSLKTLGSLPGGFPVLVTFFFLIGFIAVMVLIACIFGDSQNPTTNIKYFNQLCKI
jgi:hypothetical protein